MNDKQIYAIDDKHVYMIGKYGPVIRKDEDGTTSFIPVKKDLDILKIQNNSYTLEEMIDKSAVNNSKILGKFKDNDVILKKGKYGNYIQCDGKNYSVKHVKKKMEHITLKDVLGVLNGKTNSNTNVLLCLTPNISIRKGKYGDYIFYKTEKMQKPRFLNLKKKNWRNIANDELLNWIKNEYNI